MSYLSSTTRILSLGLNASPAFILRCGSAPWNVTNAQSGVINKVVGSQICIGFNQLKLRPICTTRSNSFGAAGGGSKGTPSGDTGSGANGEGISASNDTTSCPADTHNGKRTVDHDYKTILLTRPNKHVVSIELNRPKARNAFGLDSAREMIDIFDNLDADASVRCVLLSGNGPDFTSGVDLKSFMGVYGKLLEIEDVAHRAKFLRTIIQQFQAPFKRMSSFSKPIICVTHGLCLGLGMEFAACSDVRYCSRDAKMAIREVLIGIAADVGSLQLMPTLVANKSLLNELIFTGRHLTVEEALKLGFVSREFDTKTAAMAGALGLAQTIASRSPVAVQGSKLNMRFSIGKPFGVGLDYNAVWNAAMMQGGDTVKAIEAILSKNEAVEYDDF